MLRNPGIVLLRVLRVAACALSLSANVGLRADDSSADDASEEFATNWVGFFARYCLDCHSGDAAEAGLALDAITTSEQLVTNRATTDKILEALRFGIMPPVDATQPKPHDVDVFIDRVERVLRHADRNAPSNPGRITMRRLNRTEYTNTVRDLLGIDFDPAADFPADEVGYGFDNIGDVLTVSPLLMERYLTASESIVARALSRAPPVPPQRVVRSHEMEPFGFEDAEATFRPIKSESAGDPSSAGPAVATFEVPPGKYQFRTRLSAEAPDDQLVQAAVFASGPQWEQSPETEGLIDRLCGTGWESLRPFALLETVEVTSRKALFPHDLKVDIPEMSGVNRIAIALFRPTDDEHPVTVHVGWFTIDGPIVESPCLFRQQVDRLADAPTERATRELLSWLLLRAYRRPPTEGELEVLCKLVTDTQAGGSSWEDGVAWALQAVLVSPKFLFRMELDADPNSPDPRPVDEYQLASRLSYFLWSTMPDDELLDLAERGELSANLESQVRRMLADPRASALVDNFVLQWLELKKLAFVSPDRELFPSFAESLRTSMLEETRLFAEAIMREDRNVLEFLGADFTFLNEPLARHYALANASLSPVPDGGDIRGPRFRRVDFAAENRGGLLRQASILTVTSNPTRTSPVKRGRWVLERLLGKSPPPPPPDVPELEEADGPLTGTLRERMEQHRRDPRCASCHQQMDPIGFAFENYDAIGRFRTRDGEHEIDATGTLPGGVSFDGPSELIDILKGKREEFVRTLTENMLTYALGRGLEYYDRRAVNQIVESMEPQDDRFSALVLGIVQSEPFRLRRGN